MTESTRLSVAPAAAGVTNAIAVRRKQKFCTKNMTTATISDRPKSMNARGVSNSEKTKRTTEQATRSRQNGHVNQRFTNSFCSLPFSFSSASVITFFFSDFSDFSSSFSPSSSAFDAKEWIGSKNFFWLEDSTAIMFDSAVDFDE